MNSLVKKLLVAGMLLAATSSPVVLGAAGTDGAGAATEARIINEANATNDERRFIAAVKADDLDTALSFASMNKRLCHRNSRVISYLRGCILADQLRLRRAAAEEKNARELAIALLMAPTVGIASTRSTSKAD